MEKNIKIIVLETYYDVEEKDVIPKDTIRWLTKKRLKELLEKNVKVKLLEMRKCIHERTKTNRKNATRNLR